MEKTLLNSELVSFLSNFEREIIRDFSVIQLEKTIKCIVDSSKKFNLYIFDSKNDIVNRINNLENKIDTEHINIVLCPTFITKGNVSFIRNTHPIIRAILKDIDILPGILVVDTITDEKTFLKYKNLDELDNILITNNIVKIQKKYQESVEKNRYVYFLHMSDLHIGKVEDIRLKDMLRIVENIAYQYSPETIVPVVSGDIMDHPNITPPTKHINYPAAA